ncbi:MAG: hypothetical protein JSV85_00395 [Candidatus Bathyarchaeota archaeon]|nr:MAG: hypothetical protein JSV85_00395 [Candidatus Bathyarchaeota archaeon]
MKKAPQERGSLGEKLFHLLLAHVHGFQEAVGLQGGDAHVGIGVPRYNCYNYQKEIRTALLEAEQLKAKAVMQLRRLACR